MEVFWHPWIETYLDKVEGLRETIMNPQRGIGVSIHDEERKFTIVAKPYFQSDREMVVWNVEVWPDFEGTINVNRPRDERLDVT